MPRRMLSAMRTETARSTPATSSTSCSTWLTALSARTAVSLADQIAAADVDKNGKVDSTDVFYVMYYVALKGAGTPKTWEEIIK